ncbi:MAG: hypothetical protein ACOCX2_11175, partial [Armatimonadota bacterium]
DFDELYDLDAWPMHNVAADAAMADAKHEMIRRLGGFLQTDPRWNCYWHTFRLDRYELLELEGGDFQMFRPE